MGQIFNPVKKDDWQGLNIVLEQLFQGSTTKTEAQTVTPQKSTRDNVKTVVVDSSRVYPDGQPQAEVVDLHGIVGETGIDIMAKETADEYANLPDEAKVSITDASKVISPNYYKNLIVQVQTPSTYLMDINADWLTLHDNSIPNKTVSIPNVDVTNNPHDIVGAGGRDSIGTYTGWGYFYVIYNPNFNLVSSLSSQSSTTPTLPSGYEYFMRVGAALMSAGHLVNYTQLIQHENRMWCKLWSLTNAEPAVVDTLESVTVSNACPPTAIEVIGLFGFSTTSGTPRSMGISSDSAGNLMILNTLHTGSVVGDLQSALYFSLPLLTAQTLWWKASSKQAIYGLIILGYVDGI